MEQRGGKERSQHRESQDQADEVRRTIEKLQTLKDLQPELFAFEDGLASKIASAGRMKFNQIRKFFGHVKNLESKIKGKKVAKRSILNSKESLIYLYLSWFMALQEMW
ncbi:MAG: type III-A CRISPR-associated protein Csm2 [Candidatus Calescibacterium sp.]|nr:type III-A CRISPR-associated protein Csm2 [Candidatus Calescibacterium sp.]MDW8087705.1 hypothetical protein [Candidatus Calescibacterium sp.]